MERNILNFLVVFLNSISLGKLISFRARQLRISPELKPVCVHKKLYCTDGLPHYELVNLSSYFFKLHHINFLRFKCRWCAAAGLVFFFCSAATFYFVNISTFFRSTMRLSIIQWLSKVRNFYA